MVYLHRPAFKNKGCDFVVNCEPLIPRDGGKRFKNPRHVDLIQELKFISQENMTLKEAIFDLIVGIYECRDVNDVTQEICKLIPDNNFRMRMERALKVLKWLFIEQDITDWNTSGRAMFMNSIKSNF